MDIYERVYQRIYQFYTSRKREDFKGNPAVLLEDVQPRLTLLTRALTGQATDIYPAEKYGGIKGEHILLPVKINMFESLETGIKFFIFRTVFHATELLYGKNDRDFTLQILFEQFPSTELIHTDLLKQMEDAFVKEELEFEREWLYGGHIEADFVDGELAQADDNVPQANNSVEAETEIEAKPVDSIETLMVDKKQQEDYVITHNFEKVETAEEFSGIWRDFDGDDSLEHHQDALDEINMRQTVRVDDMVHSIYKAQFASNLTVGESEQLKESGHFISYPEWSYHAKAYKPDYCRVYPLLYMALPNDYGKRTLADNNALLTSLKRTFSRYNNQLSKVNRLSQGEDFDLDAVIDHKIEVLAGQTPTDKIYVTKQKKKKQLSLLFLMDLSLSSDGYTAGNRIIDIEKQVAILLGEVWEEYEVDFQVDGYFSKTRNFCTYITLKQFDDSWEHGKRNIGAITPQGYTRIGPAIRHAGELLKKRRNQNRWVILLSDGKPNDYDRYEGQYGIRDVKKALLELKKDHIQSYAFAIEKQAQFYLPQMFGNDHFSILSSPTELAKAMAHLYGRMI